MYVKKIINEENTIQMQSKTLTSMSCTNYEKKNANIFSPANFEYTSMGKKKLKQ